MHALTIKGKPKELNMETFNAKRISQLAGLILFSSSVMGSVLAQESTTISQIDIAAVDSTTEVAVINTNNYVQHACASAKHVNSISVTATGEAPLYQLAQIALNRAQPIEISSTGVCTNLQDGSFVDTGDDLKVLYEKSVADGIQTVTASSALNFVARTQFELVEGVLHSDFDVQFSLTPDSTPVFSTPVAYDETMQQYWHDFGQLEAGTYNLVIRITDKVTLEVLEQKYLVQVEDEPLSMKGGPVYESNGILYFQLPTGEILEVKLVDGVWQVQESSLTYEEMILLSVSTSFTFEYADFNGDSSLDIKLVGVEQSIAIVIEHVNGNYQVISAASNKPVLFIHTDILGSPVAETDINGEVQ